MTFQYLGNWVRVQMWLPEVNCFTLSLPLNSTFNSLSWLKCHPASFPNLIHKLSSYAKLLHAHIHTYYSSMGTLLVDFQQTLLWLHFTIHYTLSLFYWSEMTHGSYPYDSISKYTSEGFDYRAIRFATALHIRALRSNWTLLRATTAHAM